MIENLDNYRVFYYTAECGNMRQAAETLGVAPPTVTRIIHDLESDFKCQLFIRSKRGVQLTVAGQLLYARVQPAFGLLRMGENELRTISNMDKGSINVAISGVATQEFLLTDCFQRFHSLHPHIKLRIHHVSSSEANEAILSGEFDFAVLPSDSTNYNELIDKRPLFEIQDVAVIGQQYTKLASHPTTLSELSKHPLIFTPKGFYAFTHYENEFKKRGLKFNPSIETSVINEQLLAAELGLGYTFIPYIFAMKSIQSGKLSIINIPTDLLLKSTFYLFTPKSAPLTRAAQIFVDILMDSIQHGYIKTQLQSLSKY